MKRSKSGKTWLKTASDALIAHGANPALSQFKQVGNLMVLLVASCLPGWGAETAQSNLMVRISASGAVVWVPGTLWLAGGPGEKHSGIRFDFGMPDQVPEKRWQEEDGVPVYHLSWLKKGIRYTQSVLMTRQSADSSALKQTVAGTGALLVRLTGENVAEEYTEATASVSVRADERKLGLEMRGDLLYADVHGNPVMIGAVEVSSGAVRKSQGLVLQFQGDMPPATTGSMTLKIPVNRLETETAINWLRDLDFAEEVRRVRNYWRTQTNLTAQATFPVIFAEPIDNAVP